MRGQFKLAILKFHILWICLNVVVQVSMNLAKDLNPYNFLEVLLIFSCGLWRKR